MRYHARMASQEGATFGNALKAALRAARINQAELARRLGIDAGSVSRWANDKAVPHVDAVARIEEELGADLSLAFERSAPAYELYVSAPITGLGKRGLASHHDAVAEVVAAAQHHVNSLYWPGENVRDTTDLVAPDIATEQNLRNMQHCSAFLYLQFAEIIRPSSALIELGCALGRRMKTTIIMHEDVQQAFMLDGFGAVASNLSFLPKARIYRVHSIDDACDLVDRNGRQLLGLT